MCESSAFMKDPETLPRGRFIMDFSMKKVATYFRLLGYDTVCDRAISHDDIVKIAAAEDRCVITNSPLFSRRLAAHSLRKQREVTPARASGRRCVMYTSDGDSVYSDTSDAPRKEVPFIEISQCRKANFQSTIVGLIERAQLVYDTLFVFSRCVDCNDMLVEAEKSFAKGSVLESVFAVYQDFTMCPRCKKVFWGFHEEEALNYKTLRTLEMLRSLCIRAGAPVLCRREKETSIKTIYSLPRSVKSNILSFLEKEYLATLIGVFPALANLVNGRSIPSTEKKGFLTSHQN